MLDLQEAFFQTITRSITEIQRSKAHITRSQRMGSKHGGRPSRKERGTERILRSLKCI